MARTLTGLTDFEKEIIKQEIDLIDKTIARIDDIQLRLKNWAIAIWGGSLYLVTEHLGKSGTLVLLTMIIPLMFGALDMIWAKQILVVNYREEKIAAFINGEPGDDQFPLLDPVAKKYRNDPGYIKKVNYSKALKHKGMLFFYLSLVAISLVLGICLLK